MVLLIVGFNLIPLLHDSLYSSTTVAVMNTIFIVDALLNQYTSLLTVIHYKTIFYGHRIWIWSIIGSGAFLRIVQMRSPNPICLFYGT